MNEKKTHECDERTRAFFADKPSWYVTTLGQCEKCGLMYKPSLGHVCPVEKAATEEKIRAAASYFRQRRTALKKETEESKEG